MASAILPIALMVGGTIFQAMGQANAASATQQGYDYAARAAQINAGQANATAQRAAIQRQREGTLAIETAEARAAGSGAGATDPTVLNIEGNLKKQGTYNALTELWSGSERARGFQQEAVTDTYKGDLAQAAVPWEVAGTILSGATTLYGNYGGGGPPGSNTLPTSVVPGSGWTTAYGGSASYR